MFSGNSSIKIDRNKYTRTIRLCQKKKREKVNCVKFTTANQTEKVKKLLTFGKVSSVYAESRQVSHENKMRLGFLDTINWD